MRHALHPCPPAPAPRRLPALARRAVLAGLGTLPAAGATATPIADGQTLGFRILRNDSQIGTHLLTFTIAPGRITVRIVTDIRVRIALITVYRYAHRAEEHWRDGRFTAFDGETDDDGSQYRTVMRRIPEGIHVEGRKAPATPAPAEALPLTHWNRRMLEGPMLSGQTGELMRPSITRAGRDSVPTAAGAFITAERMELRGTPDIDTWYEPDGRWAGQVLTARDGSTIRYERVS